VSPLEDVERITGHILAARFRFASERDLQQGLLSVLRGHGESVCPEVRLSDRDRIDFLVAKTIGIEVKTKGSRSDVVLQLMRYAEHDAIDALILVTTRAQLANMPPTMNSKPIHVIYLQAGAFR
jgi:hypothetical protein